MTTKPRLLFLGAGLLALAACGQAGTTPAGTGSGTPTAPGTTAPATTTPATTAPTSPTPPAAPTAPPAGTGTWVKAGVPSSLLLAATDTRALLLLDGRSGDTDEPGAAAVAAVDVATGATTWERTDLIATADDRSDVVTGSDLLVATTAANGRASAVGIDWATGATAWTLDLGPLGEPGGSADAVCATRLIAPTPDSVVAVSTRCDLEDHVTVRVLDPATGAVRGTEHSTWSASFPAITMDNRVVLTAADEQHRMLLVLDPNTGAAHTVPLGNDFYGPYSYTVDTYDAWNVVVSAYRTSTDGEVSTVATQRVGVDSGEAADIPTTCFGWTDVAALPEAGQCLAAGGVGEPGADGLGLFVSDLAGTTTVWEGGYEGGWIYDGYNPYDGVTSPAGVGYWAVRDADRIQVLPGVADPTPVFEAAWDGSLTSLSVQAGYLVAGSEHLWVLDVEDGAAAWTPVLEHAGRFGGADGPVIAAVTADGLWLGTTAG